MIFYRIKSRIIYKARAIIMKKKSRNTKKVKNIILDKGVIIHNNNMQYGNDLRLFPYVFFGGKGKITIGNNVMIGLCTSIYSSKNIVIGNDVMIAQHVMIVDADHGISKNTKMIDQKIISEDVIIEDDVWIGAGVQILKGAHICKGAVIGAGSVVKGTIPEYAIAVGSPAKVIKYRE